jgi:hypothetical protein
MSATDEHVALIFLGKSSITWIVSDITTIAKSIHVRALVESRHIELPSAPAGADFFP